MRRWRRGGSKLGRQGRCRRSPAQVAPRTGTTTGPEGQRLASLAGGRGKATAAAVTMFDQARPRPKLWSVVAASRLGGRPTVRSRRPAIINVASTLTRACSAESAAVEADRIDLSRNGSPGSIGRRRCDRSTMHRIRRGWWRFKELDDQNVEPLTPFARVSAVRPDSVAERRVGHAPKGASVKMAGSPNTPATRPAREATPVR